jgi:hypothetical protein
VIASLAAVALLNSLVVATVERRRALRLIGRVGATRGQAAAVFGWHALFVTVTVTGLAAGVAADAVTLLTVAKAATGTWVPFIPPAPAAALTATVVALAGGAVMIPFHLMSRREPTLSSAARAGSARVDADDVGPVEDAGGQGRRHLGGEGEVPGRVARPAGVDEDGAQAVTGVFCLDPQQRHLDSRAVRVAVVQRELRGGALGGLAARRPMQDGRGHPVREAGPVGARGVR